MYFFKALSKLIIYVVLVILLVLAWVWLVFVVSEMLSSDAEAQENKKTEAHKALNNNFFIV